MVGDIGIFSRCRIGMVWEVFSEGERYQDSQYTKTELFGA